MNTFILIFVFFTKISCFPTGPPVTVQTSRGSITGFYYDQGSNRSMDFYGQADVFLGIPYAQAPVGPLRYSKTVRIDKFQNDAINATTYKPMCVQHDGNGKFNASYMDEDCLYINIYSPNVSSSSKYPVMVYIHGGGLMTGDGRVDFHGTIRNFVARDVVVASIQYRLGFLGFFTTFTDEFSPNLGMLDQVEALKFIQDEISNFGGDPSKITIFGESAGSASVSAHTYSPLSQSLFKQGIQESGTILTCFEDALGPTNRNIIFAKTACNITDDLWDAKNYTMLKSCLMSLSLEEGIALQVAVDNQIGNAVCWNMVQDSYFMPDVPRNLAKKRPNKPMIIGTNKDEWALFAEYDVSLYSKNYSETRIVQRFANLFGNQTDLALELFENLYLDPNVSDDDQAAWWQFVVDVGTSFVFSAFTTRDIELHLWNNNTQVYTYEFTYFTKGFWPYTIYNISGYYPVPHVSEIPFVFFWEAITDCNNTDCAQNIAVADLIGESWTNFAKTGNPGASWTPTTSTMDKMEYFEINEQASMKTGYRVVDQAQFNRILPIFIGQYPRELPDNYTGTTAPSSESPQPTGNASRHLSENIFMFWDPTKLMNMKWAERFQPRSYQRKNVDDIEDSEEREYKRIGYSDQGMKDLEEIGDLVGGADAETNSLLRPWYSMMEMSANGNKAGIGSYLHVLPDEEYGDKPIYSLGGSVAGGVEPAGIKTGYMTKPFGKK